MSWYRLKIASGDCSDCQGTTAGEYYMLEPQIWQATGMQRGDGKELCIGCAEKRIGRRLLPNDFQDIPMNFQMRHFGREAQPRQSERLRDRLGLPQYKQDNNT